MPPPPNDEDEQQPQQTRAEHIESEQLDLSAAEVTLLGNRIEQDYRNALGDHNRRMTRWTEYWRRFNGTPDQASPGNETKSNLPVPYIRWNVLTKLAKEMDSLFGDDAEIVARPVGKSNYKRVKKVGLYMTWRVFSSMKLVNAFILFVTRKLVFGRSVAYSPYVRRTYKVRGKERVDYEGPAFEPMWPDDLVVPAEEHESIHDFSWVVRKYRITPGDLLKGEAEGRYFGIKKDFRNIVQMACTAERRRPEGEPVKIESDVATGVQMDRPMSSGESLLVIEWYGRWRMLKDESADAEEYDFDRRDMEESELKVSYLWDMNRVIGAQDLAELYPEMARRRPFVETSLMKDGTYFPPGFGKMLTDLEEDLRQNHNLGTDAGELTVAPPILYRPGAGMDAETAEYGPRALIPTDDPNSVKQLTITANLEFIHEREQTLLSYGERLTGLTDLSQGRQSDRPNAPRTARATVALLEEGNVRLSLDATVLREDMSGVLAHFWELEYMFSPASMFFRVTEDDAGGLFEVNDGGAKLETADRDGRYDFILKFATSIYSRAAEADKVMQRYQLDLQNPLVIQNPVALWKVTCDAHAALGDPNFDELVPEPPAPDISVNPKEEYSLLLQGEEIHVHPLDNDELHLMRHLKDLKAEEAKPAEERDADVEANLTRHYLEHIDQLQHKKAVQALVEAALQQMKGMLPPQVMQMLTQNATLGQPAPAAPGGQPQLGAAPPGVAA